MKPYEIVLGIILLVGAVFLIVAVLMQHGKAKNLSGTIAGGAETFFGKTKGRAIDKVLSRVTSIVAIVFVLLVVAVYAIQPDINFNANVNIGLGGDDYHGVVTTEASTEATEPEATDSTAEATEATVAAE